MIIADFTLDHPLFRHTLQTVPGLELVWEDSYTDADGRMQMTGWVTGDVDEETLHDAMAADPSVEAPQKLATSRGRSLYRFMFAEDVQPKSTRATVARVGGVNQVITGDRYGWHLKTKFPDREALEEVYAFCCKNDIPFTLEQLYEQSELFTGSGLELTDAQHDTLVAAVETGYLDIPRGASLAELGDVLGVSESAASERFRRATKRLVTQMLVE